MPQNKIAGLYAGYTLLSRSRPGDDLFSPEALAKQWKNASNSPFSLYQAACKRDKSLAR